MRRDDDLGTVIPLLQALVAFKTVSCDTNLPLARWVAQRLAAKGIPCALLPDRTGQKANLFASVGPADRPGYVLSAHMDVVPADGQSWASDPFALRAQGTKLFGRGTADMKGFIAVALAAMLEAAQRPLASPLHLALSFDEEVGCLGVPALIEHMAPRVAKPSIVIVGEPTAMKLVNAHKGFEAFRTVVHGKGGHSSDPLRGCNAIEAACAFVMSIEAVARRHRERQARSPGFDPAFTTFNIGRIGGGQAINMIPDRCEIEWEFRPLPDADPAAISAEVANEAALQAAHPAAGRAAASIETIRTAAEPALRREPGGAAERLVRGLLPDKAARQVAYGTEAGFFQAAGYSSVVIGPGDIAVAHRADEHIEVSQLADCLAFLRGIIRLAAEPICSVGGAG